MARHPAIVSPTLIAAALGEVGIGPGDTVIVHAALSRLGHVAGGAESLVRALLGHVAPGGTVMVPAQTWLNLDPARGVHGLPPEAWPDLRAALPGFDPATTPSIGMGTTAEAVRTWPGARRSIHPTRSWAAIGARAAALTRTHDFDDVHGDASPLGAAWRADARILLAGVGYDKCTALHLAETRADWPGKRVEEDTSWMRDADGRREVRCRSIVFDDSDFARIGAAFEATGQVRAAPLGDGTIRGFGLRDLVDFATQWIARNR
ncbi:aminoglycoside 3-N-acetyltransferase [Oceaniovalibus guishaninsula JLT2003]|uniref:Aminoglycoside N(3)-acetyltransferase n=1 Tax=Oceaniovalibus guishaninsula JLT2003 TaxID=1231392 RepID=K2HND5_9RHOB|nr:AAC(3) family N-acetyltransferase [Oceaniovalibus guishaninsula]EKE44384.1 aminoglycoside 3-N-acetyltransferase [Oceaniovalibus guishaninsula JLT2003]